jgi:hypothetical protein
MMDYGKYKFDYTIKEKESDKDVTFPDGVTVNGEHFISVNKLHKAWDELYKYKHEECDGEVTVPLKRVDELIGGLCK